LIKPSISLALTLELGLLMATTVPMPYCLADFKTDGESSKKMLFAVFAKKHNITCDEAKDKLYPILRAEEGKLHWYCLDYWQEKLQLDIAQLKDKM
jgi:putative hydrolase of the HAD superfamily